MRCNAGGRSTIAGVAPSGVKGCGRPAKYPALSFRFGGIALLIDPIPPNASGDLRHGEIPTWQQRVCHIHLH